MNKILLILASLCTFVLAATNDTLSYNLPQAITVATEHSPKAVAIRQKMVSIRATHQAERAAWLPQVSFSLDAPGLQNGIAPILQPDGSYSYVHQWQTYYKTDLIIDQKLPWTNSTISLLSQFNQNTTWQNSVEQWNFSPIGLTFKQPIFRENAFLWDRHIIEAQYTQALRENTQELIDLSRSVCDLYFGLLLAQIELQIQTFNASIDDSIYAINRGRYTIGTIAENDLLESQYSVMNARMLVENATLELDRNELAFKHILGISDSAGRIIVHTPDSLPFCSIIPDSCIAWAERYGVQSVQRSNQLLNARREYNKTRWERFPGADVQVSIGYSSSASDYRKLLGPAATTEVASVQLSVPLIDWGAARSRARSAEASLSRAMAEASLQSIDAQTQVGLLARELALIRTQLSLLSQADTISARRFDVAKNRYIIGKIDIQEIRSAQVGKDGARRNHIRTLFRFWSIYFNLQSLTLVDFESGRPIVER